MSNAVFFFTMWHVFCFTAVVWATSKFINKQESVSYFLLWCFFAGYAGGCFTAQFLFK